MYIKDWKKEVFTIPNLLSVFRILLIPVYMTVYLKANSIFEHAAAGGILAVSCVTDAIDGMIARRFNMISELGKLLDPVADKLTQFTLMLCLSIKYSSLIPVMMLFMIKESFQIFAAFVNYKKGKVLNGALMAGKVCTFILFISLIVLVILPSAPQRVVNMIALIDGIFLVISFIGYINVYSGEHDIIRDLKP